MSAPPLPEIFGNYVLGDDFVEVVAPEAVDWLPQTIGWVGVGIVCLLFIARYTFRRLRHWYRNRYRGEACKRLEQFDSSEATVTLIPTLNKLLKLTAIAGFSREQVARLSGTEWINFLNSSCLSPPFEQELGQWLAAGPYQQLVLETSQAQQLIAACRRWIIEHEVPADV